MSATGGTTADINGKRIHTFATVGTATFTVTGSVSAEVLIVAGGGGAGWDGAGGGGGGGVVYYASQSLSAGVYTITVGNGGVYSTTQGGQGGNGGNSSVTGLTAAIGGGGGGSKLSNGASGASGGGAGHGNGTAYYGGTGTAGYNGGNNGSSVGSGDSGGGGGGAGGLGSTGSNSGGAGGIGVPYSIPGTLTYFGGGGGGGYYNGPGGAGGAGGGGSGGGNVNQPSATGQNGTPNTGGGGGSNGNLGVAAGGLPGSGGSGIVIISYAAIPVVVGYGTIYNQNISVGNVQLNNVYSSTDAISQAASLPPCTTPAGTNAIQGTTSLVTTAPTYGTAGFFPGPTGNYLNFGAANPVNYDTVSTNLFVECWYYAIGPGGGGDGRFHQICAVSGPTVSSTEKWGLIYGNSAINYVQFFMYTTVSGTATSAFANGTLNYGNWYHLAGSWDSTTKTCYAFLNGTVGSAAVMGGVPKAFDALTHEFMIGADFKTGNTAYGYMRDLRVIKGGTARTTSFTPDVASAPFNTTALPYIIPDPIITSPITSGLVGWYDQTSWNQAGQTWGDKTGNGNTMTKTRGTVNSVSNYVYGTTADTLVFPVGILTSTYTLFHVTKYNGATQRRIFSSGSGANWLSGHLIGNSGVAYHDGWVGTELNYHGSNWVMSTDQRYLYRSNTVLRGTAGGGSVPTNLGINNDQYGEYSDWACAETIVYNRQLTQAEINSTENYLIAKYPSFSLLPVVITSPITSGLVGWYDQTSWNQAGQTWGDKTGNGNTMTKTRGTVNSVSNYVYGTTADTLVFPVGILTSTYTLFHVTKYNGATQRRIFSSGSGANWLSGHLIGNSGVAYHDGWVGTELNYHGSNWVMSTDQRYLYRSNGVLRGTAGGGFVPTQIGVNAGYAGNSEFSDWACAETIVYNRQLSQDEIDSTENYLNAKYSSFSLLPVTVTATATNIFTLLNQWSSSNNAAAITQWIQKTVNKIGQPTPTAVSGTAVTFPSAALTSTNSTIAEGTYLVFSSSEYDGTNVSWKAFNKVINTSECWHSAIGYNASGGYTGSNSLGGVSGEWLMIGLPYRVALTSYTLHRRNDIATQAPVSFTILGSNDRVTYTTVNTQTGQTWASLSQTYSVTGSAAYQYYAIVTQVTGASGQAWVVSIVEWILVGNYNTTVTTFGSPFWSSNTSNYNYTQVAVPNNAGGAGGNGGWAGCVTLPDGRIIVAPEIPTATSIGIFNPNTNAFTTVAAGGLGGDYTYAGGAALAGNGTAILAPFRTTAIGIYNPSTNIFTTTTGGLTGNPGHAGACMLPNGKIMFAPYDSGWIGIFDPATNIYTTGLTIAGYTGGRHAGCVPLPDGRVILCPQSGTVIGIYNYITNTYTTAAGVSGIVSGAYFFGNLLPNGNVAFIPLAATNIGLYNPNTNSFTTVPIGTTGFFGGKLLPNGLLMCNPYNTANYGLYNYVTGAFTTGPSTGSGAGGVCQSSGLLLDGRVIFPPFVNGSNMGIYTGVTTPPPPEFVLHPLFNHGG